MESLLKQQMEISLKNVCVEFMFAYQQRNVEKMLSLCHEDGVVNFTPLGEAGKGLIHDLGRNIWTALIESFPDIDNTLDAAVAEDDQTVKCQVVIRGTQVKDFAGITSKGKHFDSDHIFIFRVGKDQLISSIVITWDHKDFQKQLN